MKILDLEACLVKRKYSGFNYRISKLIRIQNGYCKWCHERFTPMDFIEVDHKIPRSKGGSDRYENLQALHKWWGKVKSFGHQLGTSAKPWEHLFSQVPERNTMTFAMGALGTLEAIHHELENDHLDSFTQIVKAETLADLLDQAEYLNSAGYYLASGVICRAVLEEHLRTVCEMLECIPKKKRPTLNDFNQALYTEGHYSKTKTKMKHIDALVSTGNDAAHNKPELEPSDVKKLLQDLPGIIESTSL